MADTKISGLTAATVAAAANELAINEAGTSKKLSVALLGKYLSNFDGVYNIKDYGTTGTADDTTVIHAARDAAGDGGVVLFPPGTYLTASLTANVANQKWILAPGAIIKLKTNGNSHTLTVTSAATKFTMIGGKIDANKANQSGSDLNGIDNAAPDAHYEDIWVLNAKSFGIALNDGGPRAVVTHCNIETPGTAGVNIDANAAGTKQHNCEVSFNFINTPGAQGVYCKGNNTAGAPMYGTRIIGNYIKDAATQGIETNLYAEESIISSNRIEGAATDIGISVVSDRNVCIGNVINGTVDNAIELSFSATTVIGNTVFNHTGRGIMINIDTGNRVDDNVVEGNTIFGPLSVTPWNAIAGTESMGIFGTAGTASRNIFKGNTIYNGTHIAIYTTRASDTVIEGNVVVMTVTRFAAVEIGATGDGGNHQIRGNKFIYTTTATHSSSDKAVQLNDTTGVDVSDNVIYGNDVLPQGIVGGSAATALTFSDNRITGCTTDCINIANNVASIIVQGNYAKKTSGTGPYVFGALVPKRDNYDGNLPGWVSDGGGGFGVARVKSLTSAHSVSSTTPTKVTNLDATIEVGTFVFEYTLLVRAASAGVAPVFNFNFTGTGAPRWWYQYADLSATLLAAIGQAAHDVTTQTLGFQMAQAESTEATTAAGNMGPTGGLQSTATDTMVKITGIVVATVGGNLELWHGSETATATTVEAGSSLLVTRTG